MKFFQGLVIGTRESLLTWGFDPEMKKTRSRISFDLLFCYGGLDLDLQPCMNLLGHPEEC